MKRVLAHAALAFLAAAAVAYVAAFIGGVLLGDWLQISQREGAYAMALAFLWAPAMALLVGGITALVFGLRAARTPAGPPRPLGQRLAIAVLVGGLLGYCFGALGLGWWFRGQSFGHYWQAWLIAMAPWIGLFAGALAGSGLTLLGARRRDRRR